MKEVINVRIGGTSFTMDSDAHIRLRSYLKQFKQKMYAESNVTEVLNDLESRIAELFLERVTPFRNVVDLNIVNSVILQLGMPNGGQYVDEPDSIFEQINNEAKDYVSKLRPKKLYRDMSNASLGGVCAGFSIYLNIDVAFLRIIFVVVFLCAGSGLLVYFIFWIILDKAVTPVQKCKMYGLDVTAENLMKFQDDRFKY